MLCLKVPSLSYKKKSKEHIGLSQIQVACYLVYKHINFQSLSIYWVSQEAQSGFSAISYGKTWMNFLASPIFVTISYGKTWMNFLASPIFVAINKFFQLSKCQSDSWQRMHSFLKWTFLPDIFSPYFLSISDFSSPILPCLLVFNSQLCPIEFTHQVFFAWNSI